MTTIVIHEHPEKTTVVVSWHVDNMPAYHQEEFASLADALADPVLSKYRWNEPDEDDDGDVLAVSEVY